MTRRGKHKKAKKKKVCRTECDVHHAAHVDEYLYCGTMRIRCGGGYRINRRGRPTDA